MEAVLIFLRSRHSDAEVDAMCYGPEQISNAYGIDAAALSWYHEHWRGAAGARAVLLKALGKGFDLLRTAAWVRRHDAVIIPGMGVLETSLPIRASELPYSLFLISALGKVFRTRIAFVCVGAGPVKKRITRSLYDSAARLASYRSYRDAASRQFMNLRGVGTTDDSVFPDLAFSLPSPICDRVDAKLVGVGVMAYRGGNDDGKRAESIFASYLEQMKQFVIWLVDSGRRVRMLVGDTNRADQDVVQAILDHVHQERPDLDPSLVHSADVSSLADVMEALRPVGAVVAMRYHNVVGALKLCKPTIAIGYAPKHAALMADIGVPEMCLPVSSMSTTQLKARYTDLVRRSDEVSGILADHLSDFSSRLDTQFVELSGLLTSAARHETSASDRRTRDRSDPMWIGQARRASQLAGKEQSVR
jgi:polysaccharide pyruvyl transferase WcaK-like protein